MIEIRPLEANERDWAARLLTERWDSPQIVTRGKIHQAAALPGLVAVREGEKVGLLTYHISGDACEITSLDSQNPGIGIGSALLEAVKQRAAEAGCQRLWLITTNDNLNALRFYQKRGLRLTAVHPNALDASRQIKTTIPLLGHDDIPLRDEIELELCLHEKQEPTPSYFQGRKTRLGPIERAHLADFGRWISDPQVASFIQPGLLRAFTLEDEQEWFEAVRKQNNERIFAIYAQQPDGEKLIGNCSLLNIEWKNRSAVLGVFIGDKTHWGQGYGSDALQALLRYAFDEMNLNRVDLHVFAYNQRAIRCYQKLGFVCEGRLRQAIFRDGRYHDTHVMAILREEWLARQR